MIWGGWDPSSQVAAVLVVLSCADMVQSIRRAVVAFRVHRPIDTAGDQAAPIVEIPEFTGGVNAVEQQSMKSQNCVGGVNAVEALRMNLPVHEAESTLFPQLSIMNFQKYVGGINAVEAAVNEVQEFVGGVNAVG